MKEFVTIAKLKAVPGEPEKRELLAGPEVPFSVQRQNLKSLKAKSENEKFDSVVLCELVEVGRARFNRPKARIVLPPKADAKAEAPKADAPKAEKPKAPKARNTQPQ
jgi:hypothetical protein